MPWILSTSLNNLSAGNYQISLGQETNVTSEHNGLKCSSIKDTIVKILVRPGMTFEDTYLFLNHHVKEQYIISMLLIKMLINGNIQLMFHLLLMKV